MSATKVEATEEYIARQHGEACRNCGTENADCLRGILVKHGPACCGACGSVDTHRSDELASAAEQVAVAGQAPSSRAEAADRVSEFLDARAGMSNVDQTEVMTIYRNGQRHVLAVADLRVLITAVD